VPRAAKETNVHDFGAGYAEIGTGATRKAPQPGTEQPEPQPPKRSSPPPVVPHSADPNLVDRPDGELRALCVMTVGAVTRPKGGRTTETATTPSHQHHHHPSCIPPYVPGKPVVNAPALNPATFTSYCRLSSLTVKSDHVP